MSSIRRFFYTVYALFVYCYSQCFVLLLNCVRVLLICVRVDVLDEGRAKWWSDFFMKLMDFYWVLFRAIIPICFLICCYTYVYNYHPCYLLYDDYDKFVKTSEDLVSELEVLTDNDSNKLSAVNWFHLTTTFIVFSSYIVYNLYFTTP